MKVPFWNKPARPLTGHSRRDFSRRGVAPQGFTEEFAHAAVLALGELQGELLGLAEQLGRQGDGDGLGDAHG
jgi:hypothetical protein